MQRDEHYVKKLNITINVEVNVRRQWKKMRLIETADEVINFIVYLNGDFKLYELQRLCVAVSCSSTTDSATKVCN